MKKRRVLFLCIIECLIIAACTENIIPSMDTTPTAKPTFPFLTLTLPPSQLDIQIPSSHQTRYIFTGTPCENLNAFFDEEKYIGVVFPPFPCGVKEISSRIQVDKTGKLWLVQIVGSGLRRQLWLSEEKFQNGVFANKFNVIAVQQLPDLDPTSTFMYIPGYCAMNNVGNEEIFAYFKLIDEVLQTRLVTNDLISKAWLMDFENGRIENIPTAGITCEADNALMDR